MYRSCVILAFLAACVLPACDTAPTGPAPRYRAEPGPTEVNVMSFNIRYGTADDGDEFLGLITRSDVLNYLRRLHQGSEHESA